MTVLSCYSEFHAKCDHQTTVETTVSFVVIIFSLVWFQSIAVLNHGSIKLRQIGHLFVKMDACCVFFNLMVYTHFQYCNLHVAFLC